MAGDLFREGMLRVARAAGEGERTWLREAITALGRSGRARVSPAGPSRTAAGGP
jgi:hypothetical protein